MIKERTEQSGSGLNPKQKAWMNDMGAMERRKKKEAAVRSDDKGARNAAWMRPKLAKRRDQPRLDRDLNMDRRVRGLVFQKITCYKKQMCVFHL